MLLHGQMDGQKRVQGILDEMNNLKKKYHLDRYEQSLDIVKNLRMTQKCTILTKKFKTLSKNMKIR